MRTGKRYAQIPHWQPTLVDESGACADRSRLTAAPAAGACRLKTLRIDAAAVMGRQGKYAQKTLRTLHGDDPCNALRNIIDKNDLR
jgi:hypothetical protein